MVLRFCAAICGVAILFAHSSSAMAKLGTVNVYSGARGVTANGYATRHQRAFNTDACATSQAKIRCATAGASMGGAIVGAASMYDPFQPGYDEGGIETASGELYDPIAWTAAIHTDLRETFGGIRHGKDYRPAYALVEVADKRAIIKINDVGPLKPGRVIDFNQQTMRYFDPSLQLGVVHNVKITPLPGNRWAPGPING
ncbi:MAG: RlpA-like double-psi beta-barrel domain-containing protein [Pseudolabrys sp.]|jgi:rare lipoprotein A